ncbi:IS66 family insertion sequence element accessory protein TnpB [Salmonella enterica subsp. enterica serovar Newport]|nr:IS66 family insertion sequence element accessory protein TnpB [Salmonella enterica subsp. enterica serovar Newport]EHS5152804.1 IS66 family insertion sequence element accessory protein TnpB [Salmonella enterica subsp. enterica serovar Newport]EHV5816174.1 IS66 family insertion sequence element accessory protein TnpB [Salmonella enterica subsp. enterica serovar Newport]EIC3608347.1 IS66 family insertion sequence element accessory protein TnpB [Salmonella enterica subsp. enterica serovar Newpor
MLRPDNVFLAVKPVDMRRGIDTLTQYIQDELKSTWHDGIAFVFTNKARSRIKVLRWESGCVTQMSTCLGNGDRYEMVDHIRASV